MECATCDSTWNKLVSAKDSPFIRTKAQLESASLAASVLEQLEPEDLTSFKNTVQFRREEVYDGDDKPVTTRLGVATFSVEVLVKKYKFTPDQIQEVAALFGIGPERFWSRYHYFGDTYPEPHCESRPYYTCPW